MKPKDIRELSVQEIEQRIVEETQDLGKLRFQKAVAALENPIVLRQKRRDIARMETILRQKQAEAGAEG
ncbi:MAG TPA: 50S ribosomal protein L29 [Rhodothermales bacterium]|nr:50S ribosomal protein L29 [Rhodothermales bacterium]